VQISFWSKSTDLDHNTSFSISATDANTSQPYSKVDLPQDSTWQKTVVSIREDAPLEIEIKLEHNHGNFEAWLDAFEISYEVPPTIEPLPEFYQVPVGKESLLTVAAEGKGDLSYQWYRDLELLPGETQFGIILVQNEAGTSNYQVEVSDSLGSKLSTPVTVNFFDITNVLDNDSLVFTIPNLDSQNYTNLLVKGVEAWDGQDALHLVSCNLRCDPRVFTTVASVSTEIEGSALLSFYSKGQVFIRVDGEGGFENPPGEDWALRTIPVLGPGTHTVRWSTGGFLGVSTGWLDQIEIQRFLPSDLIEVPQPFPAPLGKTVKLGITIPGLEQVSFQWMKDGLPLEGETQSELLIPSQNNPLVSEYSVKVSRDSNAITSDAIMVEHIDLRDILNNDTIPFSIPDDENYDYADLFVFGEEAYDDQSALFLEVTFDEEPNPITTPPLLTAEVEGPVMLSYSNTGPLRVEVDGKVSDFFFNDPTEESDWYQGIVAIHEAGTHSIAWSNNWGFIVGGGLSYTAGKIDRISLSYDPIFLFGPFDRTVSLGKISDTLFDFVNIGKTTTFRLLRDGQVIEETINRPIGYETLQLGDDGTYQIRISNEFGGETTSHPFEVRVAASVEGALTQHHLQWDYTGKPWEPQEFDTPEGGIAAWVPTDDSVQGNGVLRTRIKGPAKISFWWKRTADSRMSFSNIARTVNISPPNDNQWHWVEVLLEESENEIFWDGEQGVMLDNISIDFLDLDFFEEWTVTHFDPIELENPLDVLRSSDPDEDNYNNLLEWALTQDHRHSNKSLPWKIASDNGQDYFEITIDQPTIIHPYKMYLETSGDMNNWQRSGVELGRIYNEVAEAYTVTIRDTQPLATGGRFIRLLVTDEE
jgi:hypothetical protein